MITKRTALVAAGAALAVGLVALPAVAAQEDGNGTCAGAGDGWGRGGREGRGMGMGMGRDADAGRGMGMGMGPGTGLAPGARMHAAYPAGELTADQRTTLAGMAEEEKLALDLYTDDADRYDDAVFARIATSESRHLAAVRWLLDAYDIDDPTAGLDAGEFADDDVAARYADLLAQGEASSDDAYAAARSLEQDDLAALEAAADGVTAPDVAHLYAQLTTASQRHLAAFGG